MTSRLLELLELEEPVCNCPVCDLHEYQRALSEHLSAVGPGYRPEHLRARWQKPTPRSQTDD